MGAGPGSAEGQAKPAVSRDQRPAPTLQVPAQAEGVTGLCCAQQKAPHSLSAALVVVSLFLVLCSCLLSGWWLLPGVLGMTSVTVVAAPCAELLPALGCPVAVLGRQRGTFLGSVGAGWVARPPRTPTGAPPRTGDVGLSCCPREQLSLCSPSLRAAGGLSESAGGQNPGGCPGPSSLRHTGGSNAQEHPCPHCVPRGWRRCAFWPRASGAVRVWSSGGRAGLWAQPCSHSPPPPRSAA